MNAQLLWQRRLETTGLRPRLAVRWMTFAQLEPAEALQRLEPYTTAVEPETFGARLLDASMAFFLCFSARPASGIREQARRAFDDGRLVGELTGDDWVLGTCVFALPPSTDELGVAEQVIEQVIQVARANGSASGVATGSFLRAQIAWQRGELIHAEGDAELAVRAFGEAGIVGSQPWMTALLINTLVERGRLDDAAAELTAVGMDAEAPPMWSFDSILWSLQAADRPGKNPGRCRRHARTGPSQRAAGRGCPDLRGILVHRAVHVPLGAREEALGLAEYELRQARAWGTPRTIGQALRGLGLVTAGPRGLELLRDAVDALARSPARLEHARALIDLAAALRRGNHRTEARAPLRAGLDIAFRCGAKPLAERALQELRATGAKPRTLVVSGVEALTASERRVAELAADGHTNRQIAQALFVTIKTVDDHTMTHVFQKLDLRSRDELRPVLADAAPQRHGEYAIS